MNPFDNLFENQEASGLYGKIKTEDKEARKLRKELVNIKNQLRVQQLGVDEKQVTFEKNDTYDSESDDSNFLSDNGGRLDS